LWPARSFACRTRFQGDLSITQIVECRGREQICFKAPSGALYRIRNLHGIGYQVEADHA
jgi:hypothetical protein